MAPDSKTILDKDIALPQWTYQSKRISTMPNQGQNQWMIKGKLDFFLVNTVQHFKLDMASIRNWGAYMQSSVSGKKSFFMIKTRVLVPVP